MKHTKAPWKIATSEVIPILKSDVHIYSITNKTKTKSIAEIFSEDGGIDEEADGDLNIIKAAPLMYALLKRLNHTLMDEDIKSVVDIAEGKSINMFKTDYVEKLCQY